MKICSECNKECEDDDLRPYGKDCALICHSCALSPVNIKRTEANYKEQLRQIDGPVVIGTIAGPLPLLSTKRKH